MTSKELNRDIKRLSLKVEKMKLVEDRDKWFKFIENEAKKEFIRLFYADTTMQSMTKQSILIMLGLNVSYRFIPLHNFTPSKY